MNAGVARMLEKLRVALKFVLMSMGISTPERKTPKPAEKHRAARG
jgi:hypothetical protein